MRRVIVESPYAGDVIRNVEYARAAMRDCLQRGEAPFASHLLYPAPFGLEDASFVPLTRGLRATVDAGDLERVGQFKWFANGQRGGEYAARHVRTPSGQLTILMHRFIMDAPDGVEVDHVNGNRLDNRRSNLRLCSHRQNSCNTKVRKHNALGLKGVRRSGKGFRAYIKNLGKQEQLGVFETAEAAAAAYDRRAQELYGRFARLNFRPAGVLDDDRPEERAIGIEAGLNWGEVADATVVYADLGVSKGMEHGIERAASVGRPVEFRRLGGGW